MKFSPSYKCHLSSVKDLNGEDYLENKYGYIGVKIILK